MQNAHAQRRKKSIRAKKIASGKQALDETHSLIFFSLAFRDLFGVLKMGSLMMECVFPTVSEVKYRFIPAHAWHKM